jgi:hypothetical protein
VPQASGPLDPLATNFEKATFGSETWKRGGARRSKRRMCWALAMVHGTTFTDLDEATVAELVGHVKGLVGKPYIPATFDEYQI